MDVNNMNPVAGQLVPQLAEERLAEIQQEIAQHQKNCESTFLEIGKLLLEAKQQFGKHGQWTEWLSKNVDMPVCRAQRLMRVAKRFPNEAPVLCLGYSKLYILVAIPEDQFDQFFNTEHEVGDTKKKVEEMSKVELRKVVRNWLRKEEIEPQGSQSSEALAEHSVSARINALKICADELFAIINAEEAVLEAGDPQLSDLRDVCKDILTKLGEVNPEA